MNNVEHLQVARKSNSGIPRIVLSIRGVNHYDKRIKENLACFLK